MDINKFNIKWMEHALNLAEKAALEDEVPVGAVIIQNEKIIGQGYNQREKSHNAIAHAEIIAIQKASHFLKNWRLIDCLLVVTLEPCLMCLAAIQQARMSGIVYGSLDPKGGAISLGYSIHEDKRTNHRFPAYFTETPRCSQILKEFFAKKRS